MAKICLVASGKGGVGKTTICANLGIILAKEGYRVVIIDGDIGLNNLDVAFNVEDKIVYDIVDVIEGKVKIENALLNIDEYGNNLKLLPSAKVNVSERIGGSMFTRVVEEVSRYGDIVLIDAPAGIEKNFQRLASTVNEAIIVTTPHLSAIRDADRAISTLNAYNVRKVGIVVNRVRRDLLKRKEILDPETIAELLKCPLYGSITENDKLGIYSIIDLKRKNEVYTSYNEIIDKMLDSYSKQKHKGSSGFFRRYWG